MNRRTAAVLGAPIAHSLSPVLHRAAYAELGLDWSYDALECGSGAELRRLLDGLGPEWVGLSLTMPLKREVLPLLSATSPLAERVGAVNTVLLDQGQRYGENTDVAGVRAALGELGVSAPDSAVVLGAGGTARAAVAALAAMGARRVTLAVRSAYRAAPVVALGRDLGLEVATASLVPPWPAADLVLSTLPGAAADPLVDQGWPRGLPLLDVRYDPWPTPLARAATARGAPVVGGLAVLVAQAAEQVRLMTGGAPPSAGLLTAMRAAGEAALRARATSP